MHKLLTKIYVMHVSSIRQTINRLTLILESLYHMLSEIHFEPESFTMKMLTVQKMIKGRLFKKISPNKEETVFLTAAHK